jgi:CHAD domain-containing protein
MAGKMDGSICAFGAAFMLNQLKNLQNEVQGVQRAMDIECIHRMRVASRRLRSAQEYFDSILPKKNATIWEKQIQSITAALGNARDLDIQIEAIQQYQLQNDDIRLLPVFKRLILRLSQKRKQAQLSVLLSVSKFTSNPVIKRVQKQLSHFVEPDGNEHFISMPLRLLANQAINEKLTNFISYEPFVHIPEKKLELHAMRIAAKHLRYTMEIFAPLFPGELSDWLQPVRQAQEQLGVIHDCDMWIDFLPQFLDSEHELSQNYYGHSRTHYRIIPGILNFQQNRQEIRNQTYQQFVAFWDSLQEIRLWQRLLDYLSENYPVEMVSTVQIQRNISI